MERTGGYLGEQLGLIRPEESRSVGPANRAREPAEARALCTQVAGFDDPVSPSLQRRSAFTQEQLQADLFRGDRNRVIFGQAGGHQPRR